MQVLAFKGNTRLNEEIHMSTIFECSILSSDVLRVRVDGDVNAVVFRTGRREVSGCGGTENVDGLDVYVSDEEIPALIAELQEHLGEVTPDGYEETLESEYDNSASLNIAHDSMGVLPELATEGGTVFLSPKNLRKLRDLIDFSLEKIGRD